MRNKSSFAWCLWPFLILFPIFLSVFTYYYVSFDFEAVPLPMNELSGSVVASEVNGKILPVVEFVGVGKLQGPEDIAYDSGLGLIYTGCGDGWVKRVTVNDSVADSVVEDWVNTGGRPLGLAIGTNGEVVVADTEKGLLSITKDGKVELLIDEVEGVKFKLTDGVDVAQDGMIYFTDATYKYNLKESTLSILEGSPHGRFMSFNPATKETKVLVRDLYFANGVAISPDQEFVVFCETVMNRCKRYYIKGEKKGSVDIFIDHLPGLPDNIRYDGEGHYWIGLVMENDFQWRLVLKYPFIRKVLALLERYQRRPQVENSGGVLMVDREGRAIAHYYDSGLAMLTGGIKIGKYLYIGSINYPYITRLNLNLHAARASI